MASFGQGTRRHPRTWPDVVTVRAGSRDAGDRRSHLRRRRFLRPGHRARPGGDGVRLAGHGPQLGGVPLGAGLIALVLGAIDTLLAVIWLAGAGAMGTGMF